MGDLMRFPEPAEVLGKRIDEAYDLCERDFKAGVEHTMELAFALKAGRDDAGKNDTKFGEWLVAHTKNRISPNNRAGLLGIANNPDIARDVLEKTTKRTPHHIWCEDIKPRIADLSPGDERPKTSTKSKTSGTSKATQGPACPEELAAIYKDSHTRGLVARLVGGKGDAAKEIYALITDAYRADIGLKETKTHLRHPDLRLLFPDAPPQFAAQFDLTDKSDRAKIKEKIMPLARAHRIELADSPALIAKIVTDHAKKLAEESRAAREEAKVSVKKSEDKDDREVMMFGKRYWPNVGSLVYNFDQLAAAAWFIGDILVMAQQSGDNDPRSCAVKIKHTVKWLRPYLDKSVFDLVHSLLSAMENSPDGECKKPSKPNV